MTPPSDEVRIVPTCKLSAERAYAARLHEHDEGEVFRENSEYKMHIEHNFHHNVAGLDTIVCSAPPSVPGTVKDSIENEAEIKAGEKPYHFVVHNIRTSAGVSISRGDDVSKPLEIPVFSSSCL